LKERLYMIGAIRYVSQVVVAEQPFEPNGLPKGLDFSPHIWAMNINQANESIVSFCRTNGIECVILLDKTLSDVPDGRVDSPVGKPSGNSSGHPPGQTFDPSAGHPSGNPPGKKVIVSGCFDWFHSGHVRFFEEVSELGDLYVVVGNDENVRLLKGEGHPMFSEIQRRYMVRSIRYVTESLVSTGTGWLDAEPEIRAVKPDIYAVNEDGDKPEKKQYCTDHGIQYVVLKRTPKEGLVRRSSTKLRGF